jgi:hypothetical protein
MGHRGELLRREGEERRGAKICIGAGSAGTEGGRGRGSELVKKCARRGAERKQQRKTKRKSCAMGTRRRDTFG